MQWQYQCQYPGGCSNIGIHSCSTCGILVCGKHAQLSPYKVECVNCQQARLKDEAKAAEARQRYLEEDERMKSIAQSKSQQKWCVEADRYIQARKYAEAVDAFTYAIYRGFEDSGKNYAAAFMGRGYAFYELGNYEKAAQDISYGITMHPDNRKKKIYTMHYDCGLAYFYAQKYEDALAQFDQSIILSPRFGRAYYMRGKTYFRLQKYQKALSDLDKAINLEPKLQEAKDLREEVRRKL